MKKSRVFTTQKVAATVDPSKCNVKFLASKKTLTKPQANILEIKRSELKRTHLLIYKTSPQIREILHSIKYILHMVHSGISSSLLSPPGKVKLTGNRKVEVVLSVILIILSYSSLLFVLLVVEL